ncbi:unnamed protein product, partial [Prorocentrum cordatum]
MPTAAFALALAAPLAGQARGYGIDYVLHLVYLDSFLVLFVMYLGAVGSGPLPAVKRKLNATGQIIGRGFVPLAQLAWRSSPGRAPGAVAGRENLHEAYASVPHALLLQALRPYFVDWLGVPERLSAAPQGGPRGGPGPAPPAAQGARAAYDDLWHALRKSSNDEAEDVSDRFWHEPLLLVPAGGGAEGRWCTARQAIWAAPTEAPEGWLEAARLEQLAPHYGSDAGLRELFTELLGVPVSARFVERPEEEGAEEEGALPCGRRAVGQPCWLVVAWGGR